MRVFEKIPGFQPKGLWLAERVWEPSLPEQLARCGVEYVLLDDTVLRRAGYSGSYAYYAWLPKRAVLVLSPSL